MGEELTVNEYYGNNYCGSRQAKYYEATRTIVYEPEPEYEFDEEDTQANEENEVEDEDDER